jgi:hypothetical protein
LSDACDRDEVRVWPLAADVIRDIVVAMAILELPEALATDSLQVVSWRARPGSFVALMGLYESNYLRLLRLAPQPRAISGRRVSRCVGQCDLVLTPGERGPYTTTFNLSYWLTDSEIEPQVPDMTLRLYHDARLLEALSWAPSHGQAQLQQWHQQMERELDQRWARNVMLNKWLEYCVDCGHHFEPESAQSHQTGFAG